MRVIPGLSLQQRVTILVFVGLALALAVLSWISLQALRQSTQRTLDERLTLARIVARHLDKTLDHVLMEVQQASDLRGALPTPLEFRQRASTLVGVLAGSSFLVDRVFLLDAQGMILLTEPDIPEALGLSLPRDSGVENALAMGTPAVSGLLSTPYAAQPTIVVTAPIHGAGGGTIGALSAAIKTDELSIGGFIQPLSLGNTGYAEIVDRNGTILARSQPGRPPAAFETSDHPGRFSQLIADGKATVGTCHRCHTTETQVQRQRDVLAFAPLSTVPWGVAIRQSEEEAFALSRELRTRLLTFGGMVLVAVFLLLWSLLRGVVRPVKMLTAAAKKVAAGDFDAVKPVARTDEIGQLTNAFATMTRDLAKARDELVSRNKELLALNSIAATVGQSLELEEVLRKATQKMLELTGAKAGWVILNDVENQRFQMVGHAGSSGLFRSQVSHPGSADCACQQVLQLGHTMLLTDVSQCPALKPEVASQKEVTHFVMVPLKSKDKALGVMNLACSSESWFTEADLRLLDSIGYHVGLALENSLLYREARQEEELRGRLLGAIIGAQEEERKRVSRELHDGCGQALTGLLMRLESAESTVAEGNSHLRQELADARVIAAHTLEEMRKLTQGLRSTVLDDLGLVAAVRSYAQFHLEEAGVHVDFEAEGLIGRLPSAIETALFRIVQEAVNNVVRHARASNVRIRLRRQRGTIAAAVEDDGQGFDVTAPAERDRSMEPLGLLNMRERATLLGGTFSLSSAPGQGTRVLVEMPVEPFERGFGGGQDTRADSR